MIHQKICFIGASAVGKTSLIRRYVEGIFSDKYLTTIGVKIDKKQVSCDDKDIELMIWDIEGTDRFSGFNARYLKGAAAYVLVLDQNRPSSFHDALEIYQLARQSSNALAFLVLNKSDLPCQLTPIQLEQLTNSDFNQTFSTSAKSGDNVEDLFQVIAQQLLSGTVSYG